MHAPKLIAGPAETPVSLEEAKRHLRIDGDDDDALIGGLVDEAVAYLDGYAGVLGRALVTQTWQQAFDSLTQYLRLPMPALAIASISVRAPDGSSDTIGSGDYALEHDALGSRVRFSNAFPLYADLCESAGVTVTFTAGYGAPAAVPAAIRRAILLLVGHWYNHREAVAIAANATALPFAVEALVAPFRRVGI